MEAQTIFSLARWLTCGVWIGAGIYKAFHYRQTIGEMTHNGIPFAQLLLIPVLVLEMFGSLFLIANTYVWAVAAAWIAFLILATPFYHFGWYTKDRKFVFPQMVQTTKNLSMMGGLLCLILLDPSTPAYLVSNIK